MSTEPDFIEHTVTRWDENGKTVEELCDCSFGEDHVSGEGDE